MVSMIHITACTAHGIMVGLTITGIMAMATIHLGVMVITTITVTVIFMAQEAAVMAMATPTEETGHTDTQQVRQLRAVLV